MPIIDPKTFIARWAASGASERANYQLFLAEMSDLLGVPRPDPSGDDETKNRYVFDKCVAFKSADGSSTTGFIDLYRHGCFVCETKQGSTRKRDETEEILGNAPTRRRGHGVRDTKGWDDAMIAARGQAESYVRALPDDNPPFLLVVDVGYSIELYADFSRLGKVYTAFPSAQSHRIKLEQLTDPAVLERLKNVWLEPLSLDPSRISAKVTREIADKLARLAKSLEAQKHDPEAVAHFLMRCLFTLFAEDVKLIPDHAFTKLLTELKDKPEHFPHTIRQVWKEMDSGGFSAVLRQKLLKFNGGLFEEQDALPLTASQLQILIDAAESDWKDVEPSIFGTLLERALHPDERHKLGAHYTPRAYVERLVLPTIIEPLRDDWDAARTASLALANAGKTKDAVAEALKFLDKLCNTIVLDSACGTGNFLYVSMARMKDLEGEVLDWLRQLGHIQSAFEWKGQTVDPHQFLGIEINPRAAAIADLVLWIGYLQWHFRTHGNTQPREPVLKAFHNIDCRDALLAYDKKELVLDERGKPVSRWDGKTTKKHPVTGEDVPDDTARVPVYRYVNPRKAEWPKADFVIGNPPFVANRNMRAELGDGYVDAITSTYAEVTQAVDLVMYFWMTGANKVARREVRRSGLITTSRFRLQQNQAAVTPALNAGARLLYAIPDHPWTGESTEASVRVAMTVVGSAMLDSARPLMLIAPDHDSSARASSESPELSGQDLVRIPLDSIPPDLSPLIDVSSVRELKAWDNMCHAGMKPYAQTLIVSEEKARSLFSSAEAMALRARPYLNGRDVAQGARGVRALDFFGFDESQIRDQYPAAYQYLHDYTREERKEERNPRLRREWWLFEANREELRAAIGDMKRFIVTVENSPKRYFVFVDSAVLPDQKLRSITSDDAYILSVLSSKCHATHAGRLGGRHGVANTPVYNTRCATTFPFPTATDEQKGRIRDLGEQLDAHRKRQQAAHPGLTITHMYNVLEKLRTGETLSAKDKTIHDQGLVSVLKQIHDDLDAAVFDAYGWPVDLSDEQILEKLVALNQQRAEEEKRGLIRWLRPEFQIRGATQLELPGVEREKGGGGKGKKRSAESQIANRKSKIPKRPWPKSMAEQAKAVREALAALGGPATLEQLVKSFSRPNAERIKEILDTLVSLGQARRTGEGRFTM